MNTGQVEETKSNEQKFNPSELQYRCRLCAKVLYTQENVIQHKPSKPAQFGKDPCTSYFLDSAPWMNDTGENDMKLQCPNAKCKAKLGEVTLSGRKCSCGQWVAPAFQVNKANVDQIKPIKI